MSLPTPTSPPAYGVVAREAGAGRKRAPYRLLGFTTSPRYAKNFFEDDRYVSRNVLFALEPKGVGRDW